MPSRSFLSAIAIIGLFSSTNAHAEFLQAGTVTRTYSGSATVLDYALTSPGPPITSFLSMSQSGLGALDPLSVSASGYNQTTVAQGVSASATLANPTANSALLTLATESYASFFNIGILVNGSSGGIATATASFTGTIDLSTITTTTDLLFSPTLSAVGTTNTGTLTITSSLQGQLFQSSITTISGPFTLTAAAGSIVTISATVSSQSARGPGAFSTTLYSDSDSQTWQLAISGPGTAVPEPSSLAIIGIGSAFLLGLRTRYTPRRRIESTSV